MPSSAAADGDLKMVTQRSTMLIACLVMLAGCPYVAGAAQSSVVAEDHMIGEATHFALLENNRLQLYREVQMFLDE